METTYRKTRLSSGLTLVSERMPGVRSVSIGVWVNAGSRDESERERGMAHMVEHLLFKGTETRSAAAIAREADALGGTMDAFTSREFTCFLVSLLDDRLDKGLELLADIFLNSVFRESDIDLERGVVLEEINMCEDNPEDNLHDLSMASVWRGNSLSLPILGSRETVSAFRRDDVRSFFRKHYHGGKSLLTAAGNLDHDEMAGLAERFFGNTPAGEDPGLRRPASFHPGVVRNGKPLNQVYIDISLPGIPQEHRLRHAAHVLNAILGGSISSRLFQKIREERGLVYSIYSSLASYADSGLLNISAGTSPTLALQVADLIMEELRLLQHQVPDTDEIRRAKDHLIGTMVLSMESSANRMNKLGKQELYFRRFVSMEETLREVEAVDERALEEVSGIFFQPAQVSLGFLGPEQGLPTERELPRW